jgi:hypothetical protein
MYYQVTVQTDSGSVLLLQLRNNHNGHELADQHKGCSCVLRCDAACLPPCSTSICERAPSYEMIISSRTQSGMAPSKNQRDDIKVGWKLISPTRVQELDRVECLSTLQAANPDSPIRRTQSQLDIIELSCALQPP